jgi:two-component system sensor histidine kinase SenX3
MHGFLFDYYLTVFGVFVILLLFSGVGATVCWGMGRHWRKKSEALQQDLADIRAKYTHTDFEKLCNDLESIVAHEFVKGLDYISKKSEETLEGLTKEQLPLRDKQSRIIAKAHELAQHATNILDLYAPQQEKPQQELLSIRQLVGNVLQEFFPYAESKSVTLKFNLDDIEPILLNRNLTVQALKNVIHNAIKYSHPGGVVEVALSLEGGKAICVKVQDTGKGIREKDHGNIFELRKRGDGLIEPGSGLGLYCAREAAQRQGGDVILVNSRVNEGSTFKIILPYSTGQFQETA